MRELPVAAQCDLQIARQFCLSDLLVFHAWLLISLFCNAINGLWLPLAQVRFSPAVYNLLVTFITGGVSMVIHFFAYKIIFPEGKPEDASQGE